MAEGKVNCLCGTVKFTAKQMAEMFVPAIAICAENGEVAFYGS